jgi:hypothetical protein
MWVQIQNRREPIRNGNNPGARLLSLFFQASGWARRAGAEQSVLFHWRADEPHVFKRGHDHVRQRPPVRRSRVSCTNKPDLLGVQAIPDVSVVHLNHDLLVLLPKRIVQPDGNRADP